MESQVMYIGFDDTDSPKGMCTTYLAYKMVKTLKKEKVTFLDFPNLIRFNPEGRLSKHIRVVIGHIPLNTGNNSNINIRPTNHGKIFAAR